MPRTIYNLYVKKRSDLSYTEATICWETAKENPKSENYNPKALKKASKIYKLTT